MSSPMTKEELRNARIRSLERGSLGTTSAAIPATPQSTSYAEAHVQNPSSDSMTSASLVQSPASTVSDTEFDDVCKLLYRNAASATTEDMNRWCQEGFRFCGNPNFGLVQEHGGPCGLLATVQAELINELFFNPDGSVRFSTLPEQLDDSTVHQALLNAMFTILSRVGSESGCVMLVTLRGQSEDLHLFRNWNARLLQKYHIRTAEEFFHIISQHIDQFHSNSGCLLFLISAVLTRGISEMKSDMSDDYGGLIGQFGHCNQETLNLLIAGQATSTVMDGCQALGEEMGGLVIRGVSAQNTVGYLSALEPLRLVTVGRFLKLPRRPIWVLGGQTHFTVLFSLTPRVNEETYAERMLGTLRRSFASVDRDSAGYVPAACLRDVLQEAAMDTALGAHHAMQCLLGADELPLARLRGALQVDGEIVLWESFWTKMSRVFSDMITLDSLLDSGNGAETGGAMDVVEEDRLRRDAEMARQLQEEFDRAEGGGSSSIANQTPTRTNNSHIHSNNNNNLLQLDFSALLQQPPQTRLSQTQPQQPSPRQSANRPRSDSEIARDLQAQFDAEDNGGVFNGVMDIDDDLVTHSDTKTFDQGNDQIGLATNNQQFASIDADRPTLHRADSIAGEDAPGTTMFHFNGLHGGALRTLTMRLRTAEDAIGCVVPLQPAEQAQIRGVTAIEDLLRTRWPGCRLTYEGPEPRLE